MDRLPDDAPSPEEVNERVEVLKRCLAAEGFYAGYDLVEADGKAPPDEPVDLLGYACVYPPGPDEVSGAYMLIRGSEHLPPRAELRRRMLGFAVRPGALEHQRSVTEAWKNPLGRRMLSDRAHAAAREEGAPTCCIAFGRTRADGRPIAFIFHRQEVPSDAALDMIKEAVEGAMGQG